MEPLLDDYITIPPGILLWYEHLLHDVKYIRIAKCVAAKRDKIKLMNISTLFQGVDGKPLFTSRRVLWNFVLLVMCSQFAFSVLAMKGALLPQMLELWQISKTQFGILMGVYGVTHNILYVCLSWAQDRFSPRVLIPLNMILGGVTTFFLGTTTDFATLCFLFVMLAVWCEGHFD